MRRRLGIAGLCIVLASLLVAGCWWLAQRGQEVVFAVPPGTAARIAQGEAVQVLPATITLQRNDTLIIRNDDTAPLQVGPFLVAPGQRFVQRYSSRGTFDMLCSVHASERLRVLVE